MRVALDGTPRTIDAGRVRYRTWGGEEAERWFANVGSVGMSGAVAQRANGMSKALGGKATFFYALTRVFFEWENTEVTVTLDDGERRGAHARRGRRERRLARRRDEARARTRSPDDGLFDVVLIGDVGKVDFLTTAPKIYKGSTCTTRRSRSCAARASRSTRPSTCRSRSRASRSARRPPTFELVPGALRVPRP